MHFTVVCVVFLAIAGQTSAGPALIVDTHVHLTNLSQIEYQWQSSLPQINHTYTLANYSADWGASAIVASQVRAQPGR